jgi:hypothetical protein
MHISSIINDGLHDLTLIKMIAICFLGTEVSELRIVTRSYVIKVLPVKEVPQLFLTKHCLYN